MSTDRGATAHEANNMMGLVAMRQEKTLNDRESHDDYSPSVSPISTTSQSIHESERDEEEPSNGFGFSFSELDLIPSSDSWPDQTPHEYSYPEPDSIYGGDDDWYVPASAQLGTISVERRPRKPREIVVPEPEAPYGIRRLALDEATYQRPSAFSLQRSSSLLKSFTPSSRKIKSAYADLEKPEHIRQTPESPTLPPPPQPQPTVDEKAGRSSSSKRKSLFSRAKQQDEQAPPSPVQSVRPATSTSTATSVTSSSTITKKSRASMFGFVTLWDDKMNSYTSAASGSQTTSQQISRSSSFQSLPPSAKIAQAKPKIPALSRRGFSDLQKKDVPAPKKKDELLNVFRNLENDFQRMASKPLVMKMSIVRTNLIPFLNVYSSHESNWTVTPEQAEKRANILNNWWAELLSLLQDAKNRTLAAVDRPTLYDAILALMERPEWRNPSSSFSPVAKRVAAADMPKSDSEDSDKSNNSKFIAKSALHNIRNMFVKNLTNQMSFVVQKMVLRTPSSKLVEFCAKSCAYAFFFVPEISETLVRLWKPSMNNVKRVVEACGFRSIDEAMKAAPDVVPNFPKSMEPIALTSYRQMLHKFHSPARLSPELEAIKWHGNWTKRWSGKDGDLFYVFLRHFHVLLSQFLPPNATANEHLVAPGFVFVHAQFLTNLDILIHRQSNKSITGPDGGSVNATFDDLLTMDLSTAGRVSTDSASLEKDMRMNTLLRNILLPHDASTSASSKIFAETATVLIKAAAMKTSLYNHEACFALCDFLEDAMNILIRFEESSERAESLLDWPFWLDAFKRMVKSENTVTEIRVYGLIFNSWMTFTNSWERRRSLCFDFLLNEEYFDLHFNHWCPLVRTFYMRLLCWRVARCDGDATDEEIQILQTLRSRLYGVWAQYRYVVEEAHEKGTLPPSTTPCTPAPGRRLLIIRTDGNMGGQPANKGMDVPVSPSLQVKFDPEFTPIETTVSSSSFGAAQILEKVASAIDRTRDSSRRKSGLLRTMMGYRLSENLEQGSEDAIADDTAEEQLQTASSSSDRSSRSSLYEPRPQLLSKSSNPPSSTSASSSSSAPNGTSRAPSKHLDLARTDSNDSRNVLLATFKFSMEASDKRPLAHSASGGLLPAPRLPLAAQLALKTRGGRGGSNFLNTDQPVKPPARNANAIKYAGRALSEWALVVNECQNFFERRKHEGVPSNALVETPVMDIEPFRKPM